MTASPGLRDAPSPVPDGGMTPPNVRFVGPTAPYRGSVATVTELQPRSSTDTTQPLQISDESEGEVEDRDESTDADQADVTDAPEVNARDAHEGMEPAPDGSGAVEIELPAEPDQLPLPDKPSFVGADLVDKLFYASIAFSALGQIMFWGDFFETFAASAFPSVSAMVPWLIALFLGGVMEAGMVVFSDLGFDRRDGRSYAWMPWFVVGIAIAGGCIGINVGHWWENDPTAAITFGAVGAIGFIAHLAKGLNKSSAYIAQLRVIEAENQRRLEQYQQQQQRYEAELERQREHQRQLELRRASGKTAASGSRSTPAASSTASKPKRSSKASRTAQKAGPRAATLDDARQLLDQHANRVRIDSTDCKAAELRNLLQEQQLKPPHRNTVSNWLQRLEVAG